MNMMYRAVSSDEDAARVSAANELVTARLNFNFAKTEMR